MSDKKLEIQFNIEQTSVLQTKRLISELIRDFTKLTEVLSAASKQMGGLLGSASVSQPGQTASQSMASAPFKGGLGSGVGSGNNAPGGGLANIFLSSGNAFKNLAGISSDAFKVMSDGLRRTVEDSSRQMGKLKEQIDDVASAYNNLSDSAKNSPSGASLQQSTGRLAAQYSSVSGQRSQAQAQLAALNPVAPGGGGFGAGLMGFARAAAGPAALALGGAMMINNEWRKEQWDFMNSRVSTAQSAGRMYMNTRGGDASYMMALNGIMSDKDAKQELQNIMATGPSAFAAGAWDSIKGLNLNVPAEALRVYNQMNSESKGRMKQYMDAEIMASPDKYETYQRMSANAEADMGMMRSLGVGHGALVDLKTATARMGMSAYGGAVSALQPLLGRGRASLSGGFQVGGATNAGLDAGSAAMMYAHDVMRGGSLFSSVAGSSVGVIGAGSMGAAAAGAALNGGNYADGSALFGAMSFGISGADSTFQAQQRAQSLGGFGRMLGGADSFGQGIAALSAINALGPNGSVNSSIALQKALSNPAIVAGAFQNKVPPELAERGITADMIKAAAQSSMKMNLAARVIGGGNDRTTRAESLLGTKYGYDIRAFAKGEYGNRIGTQERARLANMGEDTGQFSSHMEAEGGVMTWLGLGTKGRRERFHDAAGGSMSQNEAAARAAGAAGQEKEFLQLNAKELTAIRGMQKQYESMFKDLYTNLGKGAGDAAIKMEALSTVVGQLTVSMDKLGGKIDKDHWKTVLDKTQDALANKAQEFTKEATNTPAPKFSGVGHAPR